MERPSNLKIDLLIGLYQKRPQQHEQGPANGNKEPNGLQRFYNE